MALFDRRGPWVAAVTMLALGCPADDGGAGDTSASSSTSAPMASTSSGPDATTSGGTSTGPGPGTTSGGSSSSSGGGGSSSSSGSSSAGSTSTGPADSSGTDSGTTGAPAMPCPEGCAVEFMCTMDWATEQDCIDACEANLVQADLFSPFCRQAWEGLHECIGTLTCPEYAEYQAPMAFPYPCSAEVSALQFECEGQ